MAASTPSQSYATNDLQLLKIAVSTVLTDEGFHIETEVAERATLAADRLSKWIDLNEKEALEFSSKLLEKIRECCRHERPVSCRTFKEKMWEKYHKLTCSDEFRKDWSEFLHSSVGVRSVLFFQFVTKFILEELIKAQMPVNKAAGEMSVELDYEESNALRYCSGYILRAAKKTVEKAATPLKKALLLCINELLENCQINAMEPDGDTQSTEWLVAVNRGGLIAVNDSVYHLFLAAELEIRQHLSAANVSQDTNVKKILLDKVFKNEEVLFHWDIISYNWEPVESLELLKIIIEHFITVRGFSFVAGFMELYKQSKKRSTGKAKALRKTLDSKNVCHDD